jgi:hypothetical protein
VGGGLSPARGKGLLARILFASRTNTVGRRGVGNDPIPEPVAETCATYLRTLVLTLAEGSNPAVLCESCELEPTNIIACVSNQ